MILILGHELGVGRASQKSIGEVIRDREGKELVSQNFLNCETVPWVFLQQFRDEVLGRCGEGNVVRKRIVAGLDFTICSLDVIRFKGWPSDQARISDNS